MPSITANGVSLYHEIAGDGPPLVLVHGSWADHTSWQFTVPLLADEFRVVSYDRRGHSRSERPLGTRTRRQDEDDLAALIETIDDGPAHLVASSFGGLVALGLAARRPDLVGSVVAHEPPAVSLFTDERRARLASALHATVNRVLADIDAGAVEDGARRFADVAIGPGTWEMLPEPLRSIYVANGPAFAAEQRDPACLAVDAVGLDRLGGRVMLSQWAASPEWLQMVVDCFSDLLPSAQVATIAGAGHVPHVTHPAEHAALVKGFVAAHSTTADVATATTAS